MITFSERYDLSSSLAASSSASAVVPGDKEVADDKEICGESILASSVSVSFCDIVNHDFRAMMPTDGLDEFKSVASEPVSVGNDNLSDIAATDGFHHGSKPWPLVVEARPDVLVDRVVRVRPLEFLALSPEVPPRFPIAFSSPQGGPRRLRCESALPADSYK